MRFTIREPVFFVFREQSRSMLVSVFVVVAVVAALIAIVDSAKSVDEWTTSEYLGVGVVLLGCLAATDLPNVARLVEINDERITASGLMDAHSCHWAGTREVRFSCPQGRAYARLVVIQKYDKDGVFGIPKGELQAVREGIESLGIEVRDD